MKKVVLASYDDTSSNPNVLSQLEARAYGKSCIGQRLATAVRQEMPEGYVSREIVRVKQIEVRSVAPEQGQVIALCESLEVRHRHLRKWEEVEVAS